MSEAKLFAAKIICDSYDLKMTTFVEVTEHFFLWQKAKIVMNYYYKYLFYPNYVSSGDFMAPLGA